MGLLEKLLNKSEANYSSNLTLENLKHKIEDLREQKGLTFSGQLKSENQFTAFDKRNIIGWNNPDVRRKSAYLKGEIKQKETVTIIHVISKPNSFLPVFSIVATFIGLVLALLASLFVLDNTFLFMISIIFIAIGVLYYPLSTFFRNQLRNKIVKYLDLKKV